MTVTDSLLAYSLAATLLTITPGLDTALILRTATLEGGRKAFMAALGINTGCFIWGGDGRIWPGGFAGRFRVSLYAVEMGRGGIFMLACFSNVTNACNASIKRKRGNSPAQ